MCGLAGVIGVLNQQHKDIFKDLMRVASVRGVHSAGVVAVTQKNEYRIAKEVGAPDFLFDTGRYAKATEGLLSGMIGHCRHKTSGDINRQNAHPFEYPEQGIAGVHNGTLRWYSNLDGYHHQKVDSEVLYNHLALNGPEETFNKIEGAWACVWWDDNLNQIRFIRNSERPLWFCWTKDSRAMFWASELWMLYAVERKLDLHEGEDKKNPKKFHQLPTNTIWSFSVTPNAAKKIHFERAIEVEEKKEVRGYPGNRNQTTHGGTSTNVWRWNPATKAHEKIVEEGKKEDKKAEGGKVADPFRQVVGPLLDDPLPGETMKGSSAEEKTPIDLSDVPFLTASIINTDTQKDTNSSKDSKKSTTSPRSLLSVVSGQRNKRNDTESSKKSQDGTDITHSEKKKTQIRVLHGVGYITDMKSRTEYSEMEFEKNTKAECMFCHEGVGGLEDVHEFLDKNNFMCTSCVTEPKIPNLKLVG